jgi:ABC-2 type transport system ATP-binding protein
MTADLVVETTALTKAYRGRTVVDSLDLALPAGVVAGFVGPNGAGKSTTLRMLLGLVRPSSGSGRVLGHPLTRPQDFLPQVGALIEAPAFYPGLTGRANLRVLATLAGTSGSRVDEVLERVSLRDRGDDPYKAYSLGMKQRLGIAAALLTEPRLLVLDEPTNGLDPQGIRDMRGLLRSLAEDGPTVLVSSHLLGEVQQACDWLVMVEAGRLVWSGATAELLAGSEVVLAPEHDTDLPALEALLGEHGLTVRRVRDRLHAGPVDDDAALAALNREAAQRGVTLVELRRQSSSLEDRYGALLAGSTAGSGQ